MPRSLEDIDGVVACMVAIGTLEALMGADASGAVEVADMDDVDSPGVDEV